MQTQKNSVRVAIITKEAAKLILLLHAQNVEGPSNTVHT